MLEKMGNLRILYCKDRDIFKGVVNKGDIGIDDCILVRTTDIFPNDRRIETPSNALAYSYTDSHIIGDELTSIIRDKYKDVLDFLEFASKVNKEKERFRVFCENCRSTVHFTMNGLVKNHMLGKFDNRDYIILEPMRYHCDSSLSSIRPEDTYFNDDVILSDEAVILIPYKWFQGVKNDESMLSLLREYNVLLFDGDERSAVREALTYMGYNYFEICEHGYELNDEDDSRDRMIRFINDMAVENNISQERHFYSNINYEDSVRRNEKFKVIDFNYLCYILDNVDITDELRNEIKDLCQYGGLEERKEKLVKDLIWKIGLDNLERLTGKFNNICIDEFERRRDSFRRGK